MKRMILLLMALCLMVQGAMPAGARSAANYPAQARQSSAERLDNLSASVALYPDPLSARATLMAR